MPAIIPLIIAGVSTGAEIYSANKQANAAKDAAATQTAAGNKALDLQKQIYQQQQQNLSPYMQLGNNALPFLNQSIGQRPPAFTPPGGAPSQNWFGGAAPFAPPPWNAAPLSQGPPQPTPSAPRPALLQPYQLPWGG